MVNNLSLAKSIVLTSSTLKLNGALLYNFDIKYRLSDEEFAFVKYDENKQRFEITISSEMCKRDAKEIAFILIHEQSHPLLKHHSRCKESMDRDIFNIAADHVINNPIKKDIESGFIKGLRIPEDAVIIESIKDENMSMEEVYAYLKQYATISTQSYSVKVDEDSSESSNNSSESDNDESETDDNESEENNNKSETDNKESKEDNKEQYENGSGRTITLEKIHIELPDGQEFNIIKDIQDSNSLSEEEKNAEKGLGDNARRLLNSSVFKNQDKQKGFGSGNFLEMIEEELKVEIPWEELLENVIKANVTEISDNKTWSRVNKRMYNYGMILPHYDNEETFDTMFIVIDTSGSVSSTELSKFKTIVKESMYHFKRIVKIDHDSNITNVEKFEINSIDGLFEEGSSLGFYGRGGTSHKEVYELLENIYKGIPTKYDQVIENLEPSMVLILTDFMSDIEAYHHICEWVKEIPYKYVISGIEDLETVPKDIDDNPIYIK